MTSPLHTRLGHHWSVRRARGLASGVVSLALGSVAVRAQARPAPPVAFTHVTVIDGRSATPLIDRTVIVRDRHIVAEGPSGSTRVPGGTRVVESRGKYLIPGLWDMHVHTTMPGGREVLALYIANGVTGVRDMADDWAVLTGWRREIARGTLTGPRIVASGP